jgi:hypothetical protein
MHDVVIHTVTHIRKWVTEEECCYQARACDSEEALKANAGEISVVAACPRPATDVGSLL